MAISNFCFSLLSILLISAFSDLALSQAKVCGSGGSVAQIAVMCPDGTTQVCLKGTQAPPAGLYPTLCGNQCPDGQSAVNCGGGTYGCYDPYNGSCEDADSGGSSSQSYSSCTKSAVCGGGSSGTKAKNSLPTVTQDVLDNCQNSLNSVGSQCDMRTNPSTSMEMTVIQSLAQMMGNSPAEACSSMQGVSMGVQAAIAAYDTACTLSVSTCQSSCSASSLGVAADPTLSQNYSQCSTVANQVRPNLSVVGEMMTASQQQSSECANLMGSISAQCMSNPTAVGCAGYNPADCSNPANAGSATCQCILNPANCSGVAGTGAGTNTSISSGLAGAGALSGAGSDGGMSGIGTPADLNGLLQDPTSAGGATASSGGLGIPPSGRGGGGLNSGDGVGAAKPKGMMAAAAAKLGSLYGGLLSATAGGGSSRPGAGYSGPDLSKKVLGQGHIADGGPDFDKFRPNLHYDPSRALAGGMGGPGRRDGITGPETDLFEKVRVQYSQQQAKGTFLAQ